MEITFSRGGEMADVQPENGYTKIANELLGAIVRFKFNATQLRIIMVVWRYTYGFNRTEHDLSLTFISQATGLNKDQIKRELNELIDKKVIKIIEEASFNKPRKIGFNKDYEKWDIPLSVLKSTQGAKKTTGSELAQYTGGELAHSPGGELAPQEIKVKEIYKEIEEEEDKANPFTFYEQNGFGLIPPLVSDEINYWIDSGKFDHSKLIIIEALKESVVNNVRKWNYTNKILMNWSNANLRTLNQVRSYMIERQLNRKDKPNEKNWRSNRIIPKDEFDDLSL